MTPFARWRRWRRYRRIYAGLASAQMDAGYRVGPLLDEQFREQARQSAGYPVWRMR